MTKNLQHQIDELLRQNQVQAGEIAELQTLIIRLCSKIGLETPSEISKVAKITIKEAAFIYGKSESLIRCWLKDKKKNIRSEMVKGVTWIEIDTMPPLPMPVTRED